MLNAYVRSLLVFLLIVLPLALGGVHDPVIIVFAFICAVIFCLYFYNSPQQFKLLLKKPLIISGILFLTLVVFQLIPLPQSFLRFLSPNTYRAYIDYSLNYAGSGNWRPLSVYPWLTGLELIKFISYGMIFSVIIMMAENPPQDEIAGDLQKGRYRGFSIRTPYYLLGFLTGLLSILFHSLYDFNLHITANAFYFTSILALAISLATISKDNINRDFISILINVMIWMGFLIALFGIIQKFGAPGKVYWVLTVNGWPFSTYVNYDHAAGFLELCTPIAVCAFLGSMASSSFSFRQGIGKKILWFSTPQASKALFYLFSSAVMTAAIFASSSRGGVMSFIIAMFLLGLTIIFRTKNSRKLRAVAVMFILIGILAVMVVWVGPEPVLKRSHLLFDKGFFSLEGLDRMRMCFYRDTIKVINDFPVFGTGLGTFSSAFAQYRDFIYEDRLLRFAHNDYLQLLSEMGALGGLFLVYFLLYFAGLWRIPKEK
jgi:O-antigen ligase